MIQEQLLCLVFSQGKLGNSCKKHFKIQRKSFPNIHLKIMRTNIRKQTHEYVYEQETRKKENTHVCVFLATIQLQL